ncbi:hypothetical protein [Hahella sp. NBU794]|uniref:hypothetical protein n=1 Tax=Hahella sp. NBU794 TaxID=3422590 RepID=UPI003D6F2A58
MPEESIFACNDKLSPVDEKIDITLMIQNFLPLDSTFSTGISWRNSFAKGTIYFKSGELWPSYDGERLILEIGCTTIIFLQSAPDNKKIHNRIFIQNISNFANDITNKRVYKRVHELTSPLKTIVKYEMNIMMGFISTAGIGAFLAVIGSSSIYGIAENQNIIFAYYELAKAITKETDLMISYAPTTRIVLLNFMVNERSLILKRTISETPGAVVKDEAVRGKVVGILYGKYINQPKTFTMMGIVLTILTQGIINSFLQSPKALKIAIDKKYMGLISELKSLNMANPSDKKAAAQKVVKLFLEAGINIDERDAFTMLNELISHPSEFYSSFERLTTAFKEFKHRVN